MSVVDDLTGRLWREAADLRRRLTRSGSAKPARRVFGDDRADLDRWIRVTSERHRKYREAVDVPDAPVAIVCVSNRPSRVNDIVDNALRQLHRPLELVLVLNDSSFDASDLDRAQERLSAAGVRTKVLEHPDLTLGACLNRGGAAADAPFIAKFDDDDRYGSAYLQDALRAHAYSGAGVVGKHTHFVLVESSGHLLVRFPGNEFRYSGTLAGGSLVLDRRRTGSIEFPDVSLGEDRGFLRRCHRRGVSTYAADRFNYVMRRGGDNTWTAPDEQFEQEGTLVGAPTDLASAEI